MVDFRDNGHNWLADSYSDVWLYVMHLKRQLPRMRAEWYRGHACVFWTYTIENRTKGWLNESFHKTFREVLLHTLVRYRLVVPVYCLMPDHIHWLGMGISQKSNQLLATRFLRKYLKPHLGNAQWQRQPHDHVLREDERKRGNFVSTCHYILENPVRAGLVASVYDWKYAGGMIPGWPLLELQDPLYWQHFWDATALIRLEEGDSTGNSPP